MVTRALVLAGGGVAGISWELGVLAGVAAAAPGLIPGLSEADLIVGTSAGSAVAAAITSGTSIEDLIDSQLGEPTFEIPVDFDVATMVAAFMDARAHASSPEDARRRIGAMALTARTVPEDDRLKVIAARLPSHAWSTSRVLITAIDAQTGAFKVFDSTSGVSLVDAVAASCAVPGVWPPVTIDGRSYMDGGIRSVTNADLAVGVERVLILTPLPPDAPALFGADLADEIDSLKPAVVKVIHADAASLAAFGTNPLDPTTRRPAALAGLNQGRHEAAEVAAFWA